MNLAHTYKSSKTSFENRRVLLQTGAYGQAALSGRECRRNRAVWCGSVVEVRGAHASFVPSRRRDVPFGQAIKRSDAARLEDYATSAAYQASGYTHEYSYIAVLLTEASPLLHVDHL